MHKCRVRQLHVDFCSPEAQQDLLEAHRTHWQVSGEPTQPSSSNVQALQLRRPLTTWQGPCRPALAACCRSSQQPGVYNRFACI